MQHELLHHFFVSLGQNRDSGLTRSVLLSLILKIKQLRRLPTQPMAPLPFKYHEVIVLLHDAEIMHFQAGSTASSSYQHASNTPGVHDAFVAADQLRPHRPPAQQGQTLTSHPHARSDSAPIRCELCLDRFGFSGHDAPCCPFLHPDNIKDREIKQHVLHYKVTNSMNQDPVPDKLKDAIKVRTVSLRARMPKAVICLADADAPPSDEESIFNDAKLFWAMIPSTL
jgi:hypothetical protein